MQHEALLALLGHSGDIFVPRHDGSLHVSPDVTFLHPSELQQLNMIVSSGSACAAIERFVGSAAAAAAADGLTDADSTTSALAIHGSSSSSSLYRRALAGGLDALLQQYRCCVLHARQRLACDPSLPLIELQSLMHPFSAIMARAAVIVARVVNSDLKGGPLLDYLAEECAHGDCSVRDMASSLLASCLSVSPADGILDAARRASRPFQRVLYFSRDFCSKLDYYACSHCSRRRYRTIRHNGRG